jgi:protein-S-isoprenylcysteine O-methyltransferase Ste14
MMAWKQIRAILLLPGVIAAVIPATILYFTGIVWPPSLRNGVIGLVFVLLGLPLMIWTNRLFATVGHSTLAPWNPPEKLVVRGVYRHVRNPMITGALSILLGEAIFFGSWWLAAWFGFALLLNVIYIPLVEEQGLAKRFGEDYRLYKQNVPRWIPRWTPWEGLPEPADLEQKGNLS